METDAVAAHGCKVHLPDSNYRTHLPGADGRLGGTPMRAGTLALAVGALLGTALAWGTARAAGPIHTYQNGSDTEIVYHGDRSANVLGGGRVATSGTGESFRIIYLDPAYSHPVPGVPVTVSQGENTEIRYERSPDYVTRLQAERGASDPHIRHHQ
jgi:hypothetical protein